MKGGLLPSRRTFLSGLAATGLLGASNGQAAGEQVSGGRRIVSIGGAVTEIVFALGHGGDVVATDTTSDFPGELTAALPKVGYLRALASEGILSLKPDIVLADHDAGPPDVLRQITEIGIDLRQFPERPGADGVAAKIAFIGRALQDEAAADDLAAAFATDLAAIRAAVAALEKRPSVLFLLNAGATGLRGAGSGTSAHEMIALAGGRNAFGAAEGYQSVSPEAALAADPDFILMMRQSIDDMGGVEAVRRLPILAHLRASAEGRILGLPGSYLLGFGPRTAHAARDLAALLHPGVELPALPLRPWVG
jgi:iron complex transport system substrate-binding protein